jgi:hypothetical protein
MANHVACVPCQGCYVGLVPAALGHPGRQSAIEPEAVDGFGSGQHGSQQPVVPIQDGKRPTLAQSDQEHRTRDSAIVFLQVISQILNLGPKCLGGAISRTLIHNSLSDLRNSEIAEGELPPGSGEDSSLSEESQVQLQHVPDGGAAERFLKLLG